MTHEQLMDARWPVEKAEAYMKPYGAIKGVNYVPSYCASYIEMWHHFREDVIRRELGWARKAGLNSLRIFVAACQWESRREIVKSRLDQFLDYAKELGFSVMLTLQPNTYMIPGNDLDQEEDPFILKFRPGVHDGGWTYKGARIFDCNGQWKEDKEGIGNFVTDIVTCYGQDSRVTFWDMYNECHEGNVELMEYCFAKAREVDPMQPLTACWRAFEISDVTTFHCYVRPHQEIDKEWPGIHEMNFEQESERALNTGRPVMCTECLARTFGNDLDVILPNYSRDHIGFYIWGLVAGTAQYHFPWGWPEGSPEPKRWFHCIFYPDGTPFDQSEIELLRQFDFT